MKKAIVVGALGFIGFAVCQRLLEEEYEVFGIDCIDGPYEKMMEQKLSVIARNSQFVYINKRVEDVLLNEVTSACNCLFYCIKDPEIDKDNFQEIIVKSKAKLKKVMDYCSQIKCKMIYLSSYEVFAGNTLLKNKQIEREPRNLVGITKLEEETEIERYSKENKHFSFLILQLPTVYGPWQPDTMTFQQLIIGIDSPTMDAIKEDVVYIDDLAELIIYFLNHFSENQTILVSSNKKQQWQIGYHHLKGILNNSGDNSESEDEIIEDAPVLSRCMQTPVVEGINKQKEHYKYLQQLKDIGLL